PPGFQGKTQTEYGIPDVNHGHAEQEQPGNGYEWHQHLQHNVSGPGGQFVKWQLVQPDDDQHDAREIHQWNDSTARAEDQIVLDWEVEDRPIHPEIPEVSDGEHQPEVEHEGRQEGCGSDNSP